MTFKKNELLVAALVAAALGCGQGGGSSKTQRSTTPRTAPPITVTPPRSSPGVIVSSTPGTVTTRTSTPPAPAPTPPPPPPPPPVTIPSIEFDVNTPFWSNGPIFVACDLAVNGKNAWSADAFMLIRDPVLNTRYTGVMSITSGAAAITSGTTITFKITRGGWNSVEKGPLGEEVPNRVAVCGAGPTKVYANVFHWADDTILPPKAPTQDLGYFFPRALKGPMRPVFVHLPPTYDDPANANRHYPVIYALEGQTMFDAARSPTAKTVDLDAAADVQSATGHGECIVVAIDSTFQKLQEFTPTFDPVLGVGGRLEDLGAFLFDELKPEIDRVYRTMPGPETTGILGTGVAGLAAFRLGWAHEDKVKLIAAISPELTWNNDETKAYVAKVTAKPKLRVWLDSGTNDGPSPQARLQSVRDVANAMLGVGFTMNGDLRYTEVPGGTLDEASWAARIKDVLAYLLP
ncbi:MAG: alpha/beta hydrolase [Planctomycetota bacterium]